MKKFTLLLLAVLSVFAALAQNPVVSTPEKYPAYSDREAWKSVSIPELETCIQIAQKALSREWEAVMFSDWKKYTQTGDEACMKARSENNACLEAMVIAELAEGSGKYLMQITDYAWLQTTCPYWNKKDVVLEKAVVYYFKTRLDAMDPSICETINKAVAKHE